MRRHRSRSRRRTHPRRWPCTCGTCCTAPPSPLRRSSPPSQDPRYGCLTHAPGPREEVGVRYPAAPDGVLQGRDNVRLADHVLELPGSPPPCDNFVVHMVEVWSDLVWLSVSAIIPGLSSCTFRRRDRKIRPGDLRHTEGLLPLLPSGPDGVHNLHVAQGPAIPKNGGVSAVLYFVMAEREGFEPSEPVLASSHDFQSCSFSRSDISPRRLVLYHSEQRLCNLREGGGRVNFAPNFVALRPVLLRRTKKYAFAPRAS